MNVKQSIIRWLPAGLIVFSAGCSMIPLRSLWALREFDMQHFDGAQLRVLVWLPEGIQVRRDALKVSLKIERGHGSPDRLDETLALRPSPAALPASRPAVNGAGHWAALALDDEGLQRLAALRERAQAWRTADGPDVKRKLAAGVEPQLCSTRQPAPTSGELRLSLWLRWQAGQELLQMLDDARLSDIDEHTAGERLPMCA